MLYSTTSGPVVGPVREIVTSAFDVPDSVATGLGELMRTTGEAPKAITLESNKTRLPNNKTATPQHLRIRSTADWNALR